MYAESLICVGILARRVNGHCCIENYTTSSASRLYYIADENMTQLRVYQSHYTKLNYVRCTHCSKHSNVLKVLICTFKISSKLIFIKTMIVCHSLLKQLSILFRQSTFTDGKLYKDLFHSGFLTNTNNIFSSSAILQMVSAHSKAQVLPCGLFIYL